MDKIIGIQIYQDDVVRLLFNNSHHESKTSLFLNNLTENFIETLINLTKDSKNSDFDRKEKITEILMSDDVASSISNNLDTVLSLIPELKDMIGFEHNNPHHHLDVWNHTLLALKISPKDFETRLALLLHDIGKPHSYQDLEIRHFKGHSITSSIIAYKVLKRLNFDDDKILELCYLIKDHDTPITSKEICENKELAIKKFKIQLCDGLAHNPTKLKKRISYLLSMNEKLNDDLEKEQYKSIISKFIN